MKKTNILVVTGSVRPQSVNEKIVPLVVDELEARGAAVSIADLKSMQLPFFDDPHSPTSPDFAPTNEAVKAWTQKVAAADAIVFVTPEYNHTMSPVQLNAIDWIGKEWEGKTISLIGYGWASGAAQAHDTAHEALGVNLKANVLDTRANLFFLKDLNPDGTPVEGGAAKVKIVAAIDALVAEES